MENCFKFYIPLSKQGNDYLTGIATTLSVDRDSEKMSESALEDMRREIVSKGVNLFGNHEHMWENILGGIDKADIDNDELKIGINLNQSNPKYPQLIGTLNTKGVRLGLSVGGAVTKEKWVYSRELGKKVKQIDGVNLYEVSVVGIPSNTESFLNMPQAITKCLRKDVKRVRVKEWISQGYTEEEIVNRLMNGFGIDQKEAHDIYIDEALSSTVGKGIDLNIKKCPVCYNKMKSKCEVCLYE